MGRRLAAIKRVRVFTPIRRNNISCGNTFCLYACGEAQEGWALYFQSSRTLDRGKCLLLLCKRKGFDQTRRGMGWEDIAGILPN